MCRVGMVLRASSPKRLLDDLKDIAHKIIDVLHKFVTSFVNK